MDNTQELKSIIISNGSVQILDQTLLPDKVLFINISHIIDAWNAIKEMKVRGAPLISILALQGIRIELLNKTNIHHDINLIQDFILKSSIYLKTSRPTAVNLTNDLDDLCKSSLEIKESPEKLLIFISEFVNKNYSDYEESSYKIANFGADLILNDVRFANKSSISILTICNTGKLAMPGVGTALGIVREINNRKKLKTLYIPETRPYNQGSRLTAFEALYDNLPGVLISDSMAGSLMQNKKVDCVIVGADRITKNGATANKIGTFSLSVLAKFHNIPFYVAGPTSTIDLTMNSGKSIIIEERPADELRKIQDIYISPKDINVWNPSFDVTPSSLIEAIITEKGYYEFDKSIGNWEQLSKIDLEKYLKKMNIFSANEIITINDVSDGNLNFVYCVKGENKTLCIKQSLPWVKCVGQEWPLSLKRSLFEAEGLKNHEKIFKEMVPKFIHYDEDYHLLIMEFLEDHKIVRYNLIDGVIIKDIGNKIGEFIAKTCFFTSGIHLKSSTLREKMSFWNQNELCELTEQVVFSDPYVTAPYNRWTSPYLNETVVEIKKDTEIIIAICKLRQKFIHFKQALIHGDLHTGSIMVDGNESVKVIDAEFSFYGPIGFDTGTFLAHMLISYFSQRGYLGRENYENWILEQIVIFWNHFTKVFIDLWNVKENSNGDDYPDQLININRDIAQQSYIEDIFIDTLGFAGSKIIRRILGIAHVADFENISDLNLRADREKLALKMARKLITAKNIKSIEEVVLIAKEINK